MKIIGNEDLLTVEIISDANRKSQQIVKKAETDAKKIIADSDINAKKFYENKIKEAAIKAEIEKNKIISAIRMDIRVKSIELKDAFVTQVLSEFQPYIHNLEKSKIKEIEIALCKEAILMLSSGIFRIHTGKNSNITQKELTSLIKDKSISLKLEKSSEEFYGVKVESEDGRIHIDNTLEGKLRREHDGVRFMAYQSLFGDK